MFRRFRGDFGFIFCSRSAAGKKERRGGTASREKYSQHQFRFRVFEDPLCLFRQEEILGCVPIHVISVKKGHVTYLSCFKSVFNQSRLTGIIRHPFCSYGKKTDNTKLKPVNAETDIQTIQTRRTQAKKEVLSATKILKSNKIKSRTKEPIFHIN